MKSGQRQRRSQLSGIGKRRRANQSNRAGLTLVAQSVLKVAVGAMGEVRSVFAPTPPGVVERMLELAAPKGSDVLYDLGSGDGRIVIAAAKKFGCRAVGYEFDEELVALSRAAATKAGVERLVDIRQRDMFTADLDGADVITLYLPRDQLNTLVPQLMKLKPGKRIVSHEFEIPGIQRGRRERLRSYPDGGEHFIYLWNTPLTPNRPDVVRSADPRY